MAVEKKPVKIMETVLRDAHQSLIATRMTTEQMLPIIDKMDKVGYHAVGRVRAARSGDADAGKPSARAVGRNRRFAARGERKQAHRRQADGIDLPQSRDRHLHRPDFAPLHAG